MKTKLFFGIASMLLFASCENHYVVETEGSTDEFVAVTECQTVTRTELSENTNELGCYNLYWSQGDAISISDGTNTAVYRTESSDNSSVAKFVRADGRIENFAEQYVAFYPSTLTTTNKVLPSVQNYVYNNVENFPMRAVSSHKYLSFKNLCGILRFSLKSEEDGMISISSISLSADKGMSGTFDVTDNDAAIVEGTDGVVLNCANPVVLSTSSATDFNIIVPQGEYAPLNVKICDAEGKEINLVSEGAIKVNRSEITRVNLTLAKAIFDTSLETIPITDSDVEFTER